MNVVTILTDGTITRWKLVVDNFIMAVVVAMKIILLLNTPVKINVSILVVLQHWHLLKFQKVKKKKYIYIYGIYLITVYTVIFFCFIQFADKCFLYQDRGNCSDSTSKFFYDKHDGVCKNFMYSGCGGNENRFESKQECEQQCFDAQGIMDIPRLNV